MIMSRNAFGNLISRYKSILQHCAFLNAFGSLAAVFVLSGTLVLGGASGADAMDYVGMTNSGANGGAITNNNGVVTVEDGSLFQSNSTTGIEGAGAIFSNANSTNAAFDTMLTIGNNVRFISNSSGGVGALYIQHVKKSNVSSIATIGTNVLFQDNSTTGGAGAVSVYGQYNQKIPNAGADLTIGSGARFISNSAGHGGGAFVANGQSTTFSIAEGATFEGNKDTSTGTGTWNGGGAILIQGNAQGTLNDATFIDNTTDASGGAIRVIGADSVLTLNGTNIFSGNTADGVLNDIDNDGTINVSGSIVFDGGISGTGTTNFKSASSLTVGENTKLEQGSFNVEGGAKLVVTREGELIINQVTFTNTVTSVTPAWGWDGEKAAIGSESLNVGLFEVDTVTYDVASKTYIITVTLNEEEVTEALGPNAADGMDDFIEDVLTNDPDTAGGAFVRDNASKVEGAAKLVILGGVIPALGNVNEAATTNVGTRTNLLPLLEDMDEGLGIWFMPMFSHTSANGFSSGNSKYGFDTNIVGATFGADYTFANDLRFGLAILAGNGSASSKGDFADTQNSFDYAGVSLYGAQHFNQLGLSFDMNYIKSENDMSQYHEVSDIYGDAGASLFTIGTKVEYLIALDSFNVTPYAGIRFNYYDVDAYDTKQAGQALFNTASIYNTVWEIPVGVTFDTTTEVGSWEMTPSLGLGVKFATGDLDAEQSVTVAGGTSNIVLSSEVADDVTFQGSLGLGFTKEMCTIGFNYNLDLSENVESHGLNVTLRYDF